MRATGVMVCLKQNQVFLQTMLHGRAIGRRHGHLTASTVPPPSAKELYGDKQDMPFREISEMQEDDVREAILQFVSENCCYGAGPAKGMTFTKTQPNTAFHYILDTFGEARSTQYVSVPYPGGDIDGPDRGPAPGPWDLPCDPQAMFTDQCVRLEVPHTSVVKPCQRCNAAGFVQCFRCHGHCKVRCRTCRGRGRRRVRTKNGTRRRRCFRCAGRGRVMCPRCTGTGRVVCPVCEGFCQLRCFIQLTVTFKNHHSDYVLEMTDLPDHLVKKVKGDIVFEQQNQVVWPMTSYPVADICLNSEKLIRQHKDKYVQERFLQQRQTLRAIPVTEVDFRYDDHQGTFWVYGLERKVHCPDYPHKCCWGCHIL